jgi:hypothetical protein
MTAQMLSEKNEEVIDWLLEEEQPIVRYYALLDLLDQPPNDSLAKQIYSEIPKRGWASNILRTQKPGGYWEERKSLYRPKYTSTNWMALILSDFGLTKENLRIRKAADLFFADWLSFREKDNIFHEEVCVVGNTARMLTSFGYGDDQRVKKLFDRLLEDQKEDGGWHCWESRGTLDCWEALAAFAALPKAKRTRRINRSIERGVEFYLERRLIHEGKKKYRPWFRFHYPNHYYYDVLVGLDVITKLGYGSDRRLAPALELLNKKRRKDGRWELDAIHPDPPSYTWGRGNLRYNVKPFSVERAGEPSKWITLTALRVLKRIEDAS